MLDQKQRAAKFFAAINKDAQDRHEELTRKTKQTAHEEFQRETKKAREKARAMTEHETARSDMELNRTVAHMRTEHRTALTEKRADITREVFKAAEQKLSEFTGSAEYEALLKRSAESFSELFSGADVTIYVRPQDEKYAKAVEAAYKGSCTVKTDDKIRLGGCRCDGGNGIVADDTLESRLNSQREWFLENSGMSVEF